MPFESSSMSALNGCLAWSMGNGGEGRFKIEFPMTLDWYKAQPSTQFGTLEHRKERTGLRHEFIVLEFSDGSICRIERMGDPESRFDALSMDGSVALDIAQCFRPEHIEEAHLHTSEIVSRIVLDTAMDLMDVLKICRAIHETEKTRNYTLRGFNCYFFALTIQVCLTRHLAGWEKTHVHPLGLNELCGAASILIETWRWSSIQIQQSFALLYSVSSVEEWHIDELFEDIEEHLMEFLLPTHITDKIKEAILSELWYTEFECVPQQIFENTLKLCILSALYNRLTAFLAESRDAEAKLRGDIVLSWLSMVADKLFGYKLKSMIAGKDKKPRSTPRLWKGHSQLYRQMDYHPPVTHLNRDTHQPIGELTLAQWWVIVHAWLNPPYVISWLLWILHHLLGTWGISLMTSASPKPCIEVVGRLEYILQLSRHGSKGHFDTNPKRPEIDALLDDLVNKYREGAAVWEYTPWDHALELVKGASCDMSKRLEEDCCDYSGTMESPRNIIQSAYRNFRVATGQGENLVQTITCNNDVIPVSDFQKRILSRVELQAKLVEQVGLGSAAEIRAELSRKMTEVWTRIREDDIRLNDILASPLITQFREWVNTEKKMQIENKGAIVRAEKERRNAELVKFSKSFKLNTPIPQDIVQIFKK